MLESLFKKIAGLNGSNFVKKRAQKRCFLVNIAKFIKTRILKNIERMFLAVRKYAVNDILRKFVTSGGLLLEKWAIFDFFEP